MLEAMRKSRQPTFVRNAMSLFREGSEQAVAPVPIADKSELKTPFGQINDDFAWLNSVSNEKVDQYTVEELYYSEMVTRKDKYVVEDIMREYTHRNLREKPEVVENNGVQYYKEGRQLFCDDGELIWDPNELLEHRLIDEPALESLLQDGFDPHHNTAFSFDNRYMALVLKTNPN